MIFKSHLPAIDIPVVDTASCVLGSTDFISNLNKPAYIDALSKQSITFGTLKQESIRFSVGLKQKIGSRETVVGIYSPNHIFYPIVVHGTLLSGSIITTANPLYTTKELAYQLKDAGATLLIAHSGFLKSAKEACAECGIPESSLYCLDTNVDQIIEGIHSFKTLYADIETSTNEVTSSLKPHDIQKRESILCYSSGTTGRSKGVQLTHYNIVSNMHQYVTFEKDQYKEDDVWVGVLPFFHVYALNISVHVAPYLGIPVIVMPRFDMQVFLDSIQTYHISLLHIVPPLVLALAKHPLVEKYNLSSVRKAISGAAPLGSEICVAFKQRLGVPVVQGYGMTELSPVTHLGTVGSEDGSIGVLIANVEARIIDTETGKDLGYDETGELWVRGPNVMLGYHNNSEATASTLDSDGWLHTGDIAYITEKNEFFIADRLKELIKYKGFQVPPAELEALLISHSGIRDAGVIGKPDLESGELPVAFVVRDPTSPDLTETEVMDFVEKNVAPHKKLRGGVYFVEEIPKASTGKILRRVLKEKLRDALVQNEVM